MNEISIALSKSYLERFGAIMHHNIDKALLAAGEVTTKFGGGTIDKPMLLVIGDRATFSVGNNRIPVEEIAIKSAKEWFYNNLRFIDPDNHVKFQIELKKGSAALTDIFRRKSKILGANDTSAAVGYAPMTTTEKVVMDTENFLNSLEFKNKFPETGEDVKVMGLRVDNHLSLTIASCFVDKFIDSEERYFNKKAEVHDEINSYLRRTKFDDVDVKINTLDARGRGINGVYLTVLGTSADGADCGQVGRGNRVNGVISLNKPQSSEAAAGKNPTSHVGKIYNVLSFKLAQEIYDNVDGIKEVYVWLLSQIGQSIDQPKIAATQIIPEDGNSIKELRPKIQSVLQYHLNNIDEFTMRLALGEIPIC